MKIQINNIQYQVRHNYLHRSPRPRLVLQEKELGGFVEIQLEANTEKPERAKSYKGFWCNKNGYREIEIIFI